MRAITTALSVGISLFLISCGEAELSPQEQARVDAAKIAAVEKASILPAVPIMPEPIMSADFEGNDLVTARCSFISAGTKDIIAVTRSDIGLLKVGGDISILAPDVGSAKAPLGSRAKYDGLRYSLRVEMDENDRPSAGAAVTQFPAKMEVRNGRDQIVFSAEGTAQCGS